MFINIGSVTMVTVCAPIDLGGGGLYDLGGYLVYWAILVFGRAPVSSYTHGFLNQDGMYWFQPVSTTPVK